MKRTLTIRLLLFFAAMLMTVVPCLAERVTVKGVIRDEHGSPVEVANIFVEKQLIGATSNLNGEYNISFESTDSVVIIYSMIGHQTRRRILRRPTGTITMDIVLPSLNMELQGVTVKETRRQTGTMQHISMKEARLTPDATGGSVESYIATQAGVSSTNELSTQYNVRGGNFDENSVYVNGIEVYRPLLIRAGQQEGLSFINPDMVENIGFSSGGYEARFGDKMSSVLDITYRRPEQFESTLSASLLGTNAYVGYGNGRLSLTNSIRYKTSEYLLGTLDTHGEYSPAFIDYQTFLHWRLAKGWSMGFIGNISQNKYDFVPHDRSTSFGTLADVKTFGVYFAGKEQDRFQTFFGSYNLSYAPDQDNSYSLNVSAYHTNERETYDIISQYWLNEVDSAVNLGLGTYMEHARNYLHANVMSIGLNGEHKIDAHHILWGLEAKDERVSERVNEWEYRDSAGYNVPHTGRDLQLIYNLRSVNAVHNRRLSAYVQDTWRFTNGAGLFVLNAGLRASYWTWNREVIVSPRASLGFVPAANESFTFRLASGVYHQSPFYKELRDTTIIDGSYHVLLNHHIRSQRSIHFVAAADYSFRIFDRPFKFSAELYYKALSNLIPYNVDNIRITYYGENCATGYATGLDMKLFGEFVPGTDSWLTCSFMRTEENIYGRWYPRPTDQRVNLSFNFSDYFPGTDRWKMSLRASYANGLPFGPPHSGREKQIFRAPAYRRVDIGMSYRLVGTDGYGPRTAIPFLQNSAFAASRSAVRNIWLGIDAFNLLGIRNVNSYYWITDIDNHQYAVPNYLTDRRVNFRILCEF